MEPQRKLLQTVRIALLVSIALYVFIGERIGRSTQSTPDRNVYFAITLFAITTVGMTFGGVAAVCVALRSHPGGSA